MTRPEFIKYIIDHCTKHKIKLSLSPEKSDCTGYFTHNPKEIYVYTNRKEEDWVSDCLHEYCHSLQFTEDLPLYWEVSKFSLLDDPDNWNKYSKKDLKYMLSLSRDLELDCEKRAIGFAKQNRLEINLESYIKQANAVLYHYNMMLDLGWNSHSPCCFDEIVDSMPNNLNRSYKQTPSWLKKLYKKYY